MQSYLYQDIREKPISLLMPVLFYRVHHMALVLQITVARMDFSIKKKKDSLGFCFFSEAHT